MKKTLLLFVCMSHINLFGAVGSLREHGTRKTLVAAKGNLQKEVNKLKQDNNRLQQKINTLNQDNDKLKKEIENTKKAASQITCQSITQGGKFLQKIGYGVRSNGEEVYNALLEGGYNDNVKAKVDARLLVTGRGNNYTAELHVVTPQGTIKMKLPNAKMEFMLVKKKFAEFPKSKKYNF